jgi:hypothetical protein
MSRRASATRSPTAPGPIAALLGILLCAASGASAIAATTAMAVTGAAAAPPASTIEAAAPASSSEDIRDIRGPQFVAPAWLLPALVATGAVLALGAYGVWRWLRRPPLPRTALPFELALQRLEGIRALMQPQSAGEFSVAVSDFIRSYIEQRFDLTTTHRTTEEFLRDLLEFPHAELARHRALLSEFLHQCDLVKFAGMSLTLQNMESLHHSACDFVRATGRPEETAPLRTAGSPPDDRKAHDSLPAT